GPEIAKHDPQRRHGCGAQAGLGGGRLWLGPSIICRPICRRDAHRLSALMQRDPLSAATPSDRVAASPCRDCDGRSGPALPARVNLLAAASGPPDQRCALAGSGPTAAVEMPINERLPVAVGHSRTAVPVSASSCREMLYGFTPEALAGGHVVHPESGWRLCGAHGGCP